MLKNDLCKIIHEREVTRKEELATIDTALEDAKAQAAELSATVEAALESGEVTEETALADLKLRAQNRRKEILTEERKALRAVPLFSIQETRELMKNCDESYTKKWAECLTKAKEITKDLENLLQVGEELSRDHAACGMELRAAIQRNGYTIEARDGSPAGRGKEYYNLKPRRTPEDYERAPLEEAVKALQDIVKG